MSQARRPVCYTFGNHMHWVDMQWLWGHDVLPGSVRDMLHLIDETGARGNVNFDAIGYEKMAAECPEALAALRKAVAAGHIEPVGCSYGQPYGLFQGPESNIRQLTYGVRTTRRLLGVRPRAFWEEEFYFFPQLPQLLVQAGYTGMCLFFQWTWHTPELPREASPLILWEGIDRTRLPTLPRSDLNVHQWPEDFEGLLDRVAKEEHGGLTPVIAQWLELMPSRDWMCRSELLVPGVRSLMADQRFDVRPGTLSEVITWLLEAAHGRGGESAPVRHYAMDDVWHGMTLGKNLNRHPRRSHGVEREILDSESLAATAGMIGRPYPSWDVYPTWELEEAWRECLAAQHHDNHECEALCGDIAYTQFDRASSLAFLVKDRVIRSLQKRLGEGTGLLFVNPLPWTRRVTVVDVDGGQTRVTVPACGWIAVDPEDDTFDQVPIDITREDGVVQLRRGQLAVKIDARRGTVLQVESAALGKWSLDASRPLLDFSMRHRGRVERFLDVTVEDLSTVTGMNGAEGVVIRRRSHASGDMSIILRLSRDHESLEFRILPHDIGDPDPGFAGALRMPFTPAFRVGSILADTPCAVHEVQGRCHGRRKYPTGDWMTSPQWFEDVQKAFTSSSLVDLLDGTRNDGRGVLILHEGAQQWFRTERGIEAILHAHDPWDGANARCDDKSTLAFSIMPHGPMRNADRVRAAIEFTTTVESEHDVATDDPIARFGALEVSGAPNVLAMAFFRESMKCGEHLPDWAGHRMFAESGGACDHPYVIRLIEWDGEPAEVTLKLPGPVALAAKTTILGEVRNQNSETPRVEQRAHAQGWSWADTHWLKVEHSAQPPQWAAGAEPIQIGDKPLTWSSVRFHMRPREITTVYADVVLGRKQWRDLDAKREVWATVHRT